MRSLQPACSLDVHAVVRGHKPQLCWGRIGRFGRHHAAILRVAEHPSSSRYSMQPAPDPELLAETAGSQHAALCWRLAGTCIGAEVVGTPKKRSSQGQAAQPHEVIVMRWVMSMPVAAGHDPRHGRWFRESSVTSRGATLHNQVQITSTRDRDHVVAAVRSPRCMYGHVAGAQV